MIDRYLDALGSAPLAEQTRRTYYLGWQMGYEAAAAQLVSG